MLAMAADPENTLILTLDTGPVVIDLRPDLAPVPVGSPPWAMKPGMTRWNTTPS